MARSVIVRSENEWQAAADHRVANDGVIIVSMNHIELGCMALQVSEQAQ
jgi:hypothetical protein